MLYECSNMKNLMSETSEDVSIEEMWKVIEEFGIKRAMLERSNPNFVTIFELYSAIKKRQENSELSKS